MKTVMVRMEVVAGPFKTPKGDELLLVRPISSDPTSAISIYAKDASGESEESAGEAPATDFFDVFPLGGHLDVHGKSTDRCV